MARAKRPTGDAATNARKRYYRAAERYLKQAQNAVGANAARLRTLAQLRLEDALNTYTKATKQSFSKPIQRIANALGIDLTEERRKMQARTDKEDLRIRERAISEEKSKQAKASAYDSEVMRQREARALLNSPIGRRVIGGTVEIWQDAASITTEEGQTKIDKTKILPALYEHFKVDNLADLLDVMENIAGESLFNEIDEQELYESAKITIQTYIKSQQNG